MRNKINLIAKLLFIFSYSPQIHTLNKKVLKFKEFIRSMAAAPWILCFLVLWWWFHCLVLVLKKGKIRLMWVQIPAVWKEHISISKWSLHNWRSHIFCHWFWLILKGFRMSVWASKTQVSFSILLVHTSLWHLAYNIRAMASSQWVSYSKQWGMKMTRNSKCINAGDVWFLVKVVIKLCDFVWESEKKYRSIYTQWK